ncbi:hypothetical protein ACFE04_020694 [Oxalis oulophora]
MNPRDMPLFPTNETNFGGPIPIIDVLNEELARTKFFIRQQDDVILRMSQQSDQIRAENEYLRQNFEDILAQNRALAEKNNAIKGEVMMLKDFVGIQERDNRFLQEDREMALHQVQLVESENARMNDVVLHQMNMLDRLNEKNGNLRARIGRERDENDELKRQLQILDEEYNTLTQQAYENKKRLEIIFPKIMKIRAKAYMLVKACHPDAESAFEQFVAEANQELADFIIDSDFV